MKRRIVKSVCCAAILLFFCQYTVKGEEIVYAEEDATDSMKTQKVVLYADTQEEIDKIGQMTSLKYLDIHFDRREGEDAIWNVEALGRLENLEEISICGNVDEALDTAPLGNLKNVRKVSLSHVEFDLSFLSGMEALEELSMDRCTGMKDLSALVGLRRLRTIDIEYVDAANLRCLAKLDRLEEIRISSGYIYDFEGLEHLYRVRYLDLEDWIENKAKPYMEMSALENMKELDGITISGIAIDSVDALADLEHLHSVLLVSADVEDIEPFCWMPSLQSLRILGNQSKAVEKQAEQYAGQIDTLLVSDKIPYGF